MAIIAFLLLLAGLLGAIIPVLPGPPLSYFGLLLLQWSGFGAFSPVFLWVWAGITAAVTLIDYFLPVLMAKKFGASRAAAIGTFCGLIAGIFFFPPWGMIAGSFLGALFGELIHNRADRAKALKVAFGAFLAFVAGSGMKLIISGLMLFYAVRAVL